VVEAALEKVGNRGTIQVAVGMAGEVLGIVGNQVVARYKVVVGNHFQ
jgi:hypothetical protein